MRRQVVEALLYVAEAKPDAEGDGHEGNAIANKLRMLPSSLSFLRGTYRSKPVERHAVFDAVALSQLFRGDDVKEHFDC